MGESGGVGSPLATATMFFGNGFGIASTFSRMPGIRDQLGSSPDQLAFALVCMGIGSILGMPFAGRLVERYSSRTVSLVATALFLGGCAVLPLSRSLFVFGAMLLIVGVGAGVGDVAMNVQGHLVEERRGRVLMPYWHGIFSIGGVSGSLCGWFCAGVGVPLSWQLPMVSAVLLVVMGLATTHYLQDRTRDFERPGKTIEGTSWSRVAKSSGERIDNLPRETTESRTSDNSLGHRASSLRRWGKVLRTIGSRCCWWTREEPLPALGALTYGGFNLTMAIGRFAGGAVIQRYGRVPVLRSAGTLACVSVTALCLVNSTLVALLRRFWLGTWTLGSIPGGNLSGRRDSRPWRCRNRASGYHRLCRVFIRGAFDRIACPFDAS